MFLDPSPLTTAAADGGKEKAPASTFTRARLALPSTGSADSFKTPDRFAQLMVDRKYVQALSVADMLVDERPGDGWAHFRRAEVLEEPHQLGMTEVSVPAPLGGEESRTLGRQRHRAVDTARGRLADCAGRTGAGIGELCPGVGSGRTLARA